MLINVTRFFRNSGMFDTLKSLVFPAILGARDSDTTIRIWTPACASGEETYSVAISLLEFLGDRASDLQIQMFGTDISEASIAKARSGVYPENIQGDVQSERLRRYFTKVENGYRISKGIRDMCIFAQHNLLNDPPFSQMDLICCRNFLIYLEPVLQNKVISLFHYAIRQNGYLVLGTSEGIGAAAGLFALEDRTYKIFSKKVTANRQLVTFSLNRQIEQGDFSTGRMAPRAAESAWNYVEVQKEFDRRLLTHYAPAAAFVNEDLEIIHTRGNVSRYLKLAPGRASLSILKMAREGLLVDLRNALTRAKKENTHIKKRDVRVKTGNGDEAGDGRHGRKSSQKARLVNFEVLPMNIGNLKNRYFMIRFEDALIKPPRLPKTQELRETESANRRALKFEQELAATKEYLQSVIETQEATNEELQSANEEILSSNEELQSTNEELETAKEELQSSNEELSTVNDELRHRNIEVSYVNNDLSNLLSSIDVALIMVGRDFTIRRVTPKAQEILGFIPGDIGRPLQNIHLTIEISELQLGIAQVMANQRPFERNVTDSKGATYQLRILPYRTTDSQPEGAVVILFKNSA
jgi:two-component system, chemotaxis family, CheB/CheR fusion protein